MAGDPTTVVVTGAGSGIGRALAVEAAARGHRLVLVGRRQAALQETADLLAFSADRITCACDVTSPADRAHLVCDVARAFGGVGILINNAGLVTGGALSDVLDDDIECILATNVAAPMALTRDFLPTMQRGQSRVVNVGSVFGDIAFPNFGLYSASKYALRGFSDALRRELSPHGIAVTYVAPRATRTPAAAALQSVIAGAGMKLDEPDAVARHIWRGIARGKSRIYPPGPERFFVTMERLFPDLVSKSLPRRRG